VWDEVTQTMRERQTEGSMGKPKVGDQHVYVVMEAKGKELSVEFVRVVYDVERAAQAIEATGEADLMPHEYAEMLWATHRVWQ
jgi:hypothetical protein